MVKLVRVSVLSPTHFVGGRLRAAHADVYIGVLGQQQLDEVQMVHVGLADRIVAALDVAVIGGQVQRRPAAVILDIRIGAVVQQIRARFCSGDSAWPSAAASSRNA